MWSCPQGLWIQQGRTERMLGVSACPAWAAYVGQLSSCGREDWRGLSIPPLREMIVLPRTSLCHPWRVIVPFFFPEGEAHMKELVQTKQQVRTRAKSQNPGILTNKDGQPIKKPPHSFVIQFHYIYETILIFVIQYFKRKRMILFLVYAAF